MKQLTRWLLIGGGLNWLLVGILSWDIGQIFGGQSAFVSRLVYVLIGLAAVYELAVVFGGRKKPESKPSQPQQQVDQSQQPQQ